MSDQTWLLERALSMAPRRELHRCGAGRLESAVVLEVLEVRYEEMGID